MLVERVAVRSLIERHVALISEVDPTVVKRSDVSRGVALTSIVVKIVALRSDLSDTPVCPVA